MRNLATWILLVTAAVGLLLLLVQYASLRRHLRMRTRRARRRPGMSILKPLCGVDDDLELNLERFVALDYPYYELLLGVRSTRDAAWPIARAVAERWPDRVRVVVQRGETGLNPKVNQLVTLAAAARFDVLVVSDSNIAVDDSYLDEIAALLEDPEVALVSHPVAGDGATRLGSLLDNLHLSSHVGPGVVAASRVAHKDIVVGKSMALRRCDLEALGGFAAVADVLAEDYVMGKAIARLGKRVAIATRPVINVSKHRSLGDFLRRYRRWSVMHRKAVGTPIYFGELVLNPTMLALLACAIDPALRSTAALLAVAACKTALDWSSARALIPSTSKRQALAIPIKDLLVALAWLHGLLHNHVEWRGNRLRVLRGTRLAVDHREAWQPALSIID